MRFVKLLLFWLALHFALTASSAGQDYEQVMKLYDQIKDASLDEQKVAEVESLVLKRDAALFRLNKGKICLLQPIQGKVCGAVFVGEGVFEFSPPTEIEKYQLKRFTKQENLSAEFEELYLGFSDTTGIELEHKLNFSKGEVSGKFKSIMKDFPERLSKTSGRNIWSRILADILTDSLFLMSYTERGKGFLFADIKTGQFSHFFFVFDPKEREEVVLEIPEPKPDLYWRDQACSFHQADDYLKNAPVKNTPLPHEDKDEIKITHYKIEAEISITEELSAKVEVDFESLLDGIRVIDFYLDPDLKIERITNEQGDSLYFIKEKDQYRVSVVLPQPTKSGDIRTLTFKYSGKIILQDWIGDLYVRSTYWYPEYSYLKRATYDLTFECPKGYQLLSIGKKIKEWVEGDLLCTQWVEEFPVFLASFTYGDFETYQKNLEGLPEVCVYNLEESHRLTWTKYKKSKESVAADVINSLSFFQTVYGKCPFSRMVATEIPAYYGQGLPGLLFLSWGTFAADEQLEKTKFEEESFRAHEVSHQWWGHIVGWETYHDQWLSEGFAEYSGVWYAQMSMKDNEAFFAELERWKKDIMGRGSSKKSEGSKAGPIWLGGLLNSSKSYDYSTLVYEKGAYVVHMLRNMMMDFDNKSDDRFIKMMADFVETYRGKSASTEDFKAIVEKHVGENMDWFFDQWVYGVEIPTYRFSYTTEKTPEGKYEITCEVTQENVSKGFKMWVPILLDFGGGQYAVLRLWVDKPQNKYQLPKTPLMPKEITLNPFYSVLCEVKE
jgi:hypothetical protein